MGALQSGVSVLVSEGSLGGGCRALLLITDED